MENNFHYMPTESAQIDLVAKAFIAAGGEFVKPPKDKQGNYKGGYSSLEGILDSVKKALKTHGLRFFQRRQRIMGEDILVSTLLHESGQWFKSYAGLPMPANSKRDINQDVGTAITYQSRYEAPIFLGLADADPDNDPDAQTSIETDQYNELCDLIDSRKDPLKALDYIKSIAAVEKVSDLKGSQFIMAMNLVAKFEPKKKD